MTICLTYFRYIDLLSQISATESRVIFYSCYLLEGWDWKTTACLRLPSEFLAQLNVKKLCFGRPYRDSVVQITYLHITKAKMKVLWHPQKYHVDNSVQCTGRFRSLPMASYRERVEVARLNGRTFALHVEDPILNLQHFQLKGLVCRWYEEPLPEDLGSCWQTKKTTLTVKD